MTQGSQTAQLIGKRYLIQEQLGQGGMGAVYRAVDKLTGQTVALKRVMVSTENLQFTSHSANHDSMGMRLALAQEFRTLASLRHPHIISVLDYGFDDERQPFFTMDFLDGGKTLLEGGRLQDMPRRVDLIIQVLQALAYLHRRGIIHRDLKPGNVMVTEGRVRVLDFGLSVVQGQGEEEEEEVAGTLAYIAPEVLQGHFAREAADLYAVGVMAYEMFLGRHPFNTSNAGQLISDVLMTPPDLSPFKTLNLALPAPVDDDDEDYFPTQKRIVRDTDLDKTFIPNKMDDPERTITAHDMPTIPQVDLDTEVTGPITVPQQKIQRDIHPVESDDDDLDTLPPLALIVKRLLAKTPEERYRDAYRVINELCAAVNQPVPEESAAIRESFLQAAAFVGRDNELALLEDGLANAAQGRGSSWLVGGVSGVGKTRLLDELRIRAVVNEVTVLRGQAVTGGGLSYQAWRDPVRRLVLTTDLDDLDAGILKDIVPDIEQLLDRRIPDVVQLEGSAYRQRLEGAIVSLFQRQTQPMLLILEDMQWLSESLEVLKVINGIVADLPLLIVGNYRHEELPGLPDRLPEMQLLKLERLTPEAMMALSVSMLGESGRQPEILDFLSRETEGNVFFFVEVVRALAEEAGRLDDVGTTGLPTRVVAGGVQSVLKRRLDHVPQSGRRLLQLAAVAGRELKLDILDRVKEDWDLDDWLATCSNIAVLEVQNGEWRFAHDKLRIAALEAIPDEVRPELHREIAEAIEQVYPDSQEQASTLAYHWRSAGDILKELFYVQQAGDHALRISAYGEAMDHFKRILELLQMPPLSKSDQRQTLANVLGKLGEALQHTGDYPAAIERLEESLALHNKIGYLSGSAWVLNNLGNVFRAQADYANATRHYQESIELCTRINDKRGFSRALHGLGLVLFDQGDYTSAVRHFEECLSIARKAGDRQGVDNAINGLGIVAYAQGDYGSATRYFEEYRILAQDSGERRKAAIALLNLGSVAGGQGDFPAASRYFEESLSIFRSIGARQYIAPVIENLGVLAELQEDYDGATHYFEESLAMAQSIGNRQGEAATLCWLGNVASKQSDYNRAFDLYHEALALARDIEAFPIMMDVLTGLSGILPDKLRAVQLLSLVINHQVSIEATRQEAASKLEGLKAELPEKEVDAALKKGKNLDLEKTVTAILRDRGG